MAMATSPQLAWLIAQFGARHNDPDADMSQPAPTRALLIHAARECGAVDLLLNNAGIQHAANLEHFPIERWDAMIAMNLSSGFHMPHLALPSMKARRWGLVTNSASTHGLVASARESAYLAAKAGIGGFAKAVALEAATSGVM